MNQGHTAPNFGSRRLLILEPIELQALLTIEQHLYLEVFVASKTMYWCDESSHDVVIAKYATTQSWIGCLDTCIGEEYNLYFTDRGSNSGRFRIEVELSRVDVYNQNSRAFGNGATYSSETDECFAISSVIYFVQISLKNPGRYLNTARMHESLKANTVDLRVSLATLKILALHCANMSVGTCLQKNRAETIVWSLLLYLDFLLQRAVGHFLLLRN